MFQLLHTTFNTSRNFCTTIMLEKLMHIFTFIGILGYIYLMATQKFSGQVGYDDGTPYLAQNDVLRAEIDKMSENNAGIRDEISALDELYTFLYNLHKAWKIKLKDQNSNEMSEEREPSEEYECLRRRIYSNTKEFWYYVSAAFNALGTLRVGDTSVLDFPRAKRLADENYRSLLLDISDLADGDQHSRWRRETFERLSGSVQSRLNRLQNPPHCDGARKLICNYSTSIDSDCGFVCRTHFLLGCMVIAHNTGRTLIVPSDGGQLTHGDGWDSLFLPLSDTCLTSNGETALEWPGNKDAQVLWLDIPHFINSQNPYYPFEIPEDLAPALRVLHGDPAVWWIGQFLKFILRPQPSTSQMLDGLTDKLKFQSPIVGLQFSKDSKYTPSEYMSHVEEYYKIKDMGSGYDEKRIYLSTDDPNVFDEIKHKYPKYDLIGIIETTKVLPVQEGYASRKIHNILIDVYFLSRCDYLVCTFSSDVGRVAYEMMNTQHPDASARFSSLDGIYNYSGEMRRLNVAVIPHEPNENGEIELQQGDLILLTNNYWNGSSSGTSLRTGHAGRFPSFKITPKVESSNYSYYPAAENE